MFLCCTHGWAPTAPAETGHMNGHRKHRQKLDKPLKHIIFRPSWQDTSKPQIDITHSTATSYTSKGAFQPLPRPPFESTSWHYSNTVNILLPSIYRIHLLSRGSKNSNQPSTATYYTNKGAFQHRQKLDKPLKHIIFRTSWQDTSKPQTDITHYTTTYYISRRTFQPLPRPPFESTS